MYFLSFTHRYWYQPIVNSHILSHLVSSELKLEVKMLGSIRSRIFGQNVMKNFIRNGSHGGVPGEVCDIYVYFNYYITPSYFIIKPNLTFM